jgi:FeS assembly SUF system protein
MSETTKTSEQPVASAGSHALKIESAIPREELDRLSDDIVAALKTVYDPEIPADIYELGLIYKVDIADDRAVTVDMTLTSPNCPAAGELPGNVENAVASVQGVGPVKVNVTFERPGTRAACPTRRGLRSTFGDPI